MVQFETEGDVREYVESNPTEAVHSESQGGQLWFGVVDGEFAVARAAHPMVAAMQGVPEAMEPHLMEPLGDDQPLPDGEISIVHKDDTPLAHA